MDTKQYRVNAWKPPPEPKFYRYPPILSLAQTYALREKERSDKAKAESK